MPLDIEATSLHVSPAAPAGHDHSSPLKRRTINLRLLSITLLSLAVVGPLLYWVRTIQVDASADVFLDRAAQHEKDQRWLQAVSYLQRYLQLRPEEEEIHARIAEDYAHTIDGQRKALHAISLYYRAIGAQPDRPELRAKLVDLLVQGGQLSAAQVEAEKLLGENGATAARPAALRALAVVALAETRTGGTIALERARTALETSLAADPGDPELALALAMTYRDHADALKITAADAARLADAVMDAMVAAKSADPLAYLQRSAYRARYQASAARDDLEKAISLGGENASVMATAGNYFLAPGPDRDLARAAQYFEKIKGILPHAADGYLGLGRTQRAKGDLEAAQATWRTGLSRVGSSNVALNEELLRFYLQKRDIASAEEVFENLRTGLAKEAAESTVADRIRHQEGIAQYEAEIALAKGEPAKAIEVLQSFVASRGEGGSAPENARGKALLARTYTTTQNWELAAPLLEELAAADPTSVEYQTAAGEAWRRAGDSRKAVDRLSRASRLPGFPPRGWLQLVEAHFELERASAAKDKRQWAPFLAALEGAKKASPGAWELRIIEARYLAELGTDAARRQAVEILSDGEKADASEAGFWTLAISLYQQLKEPKRADSALAQLSKVSNDPALAARMGIELLIARRDFAGAEKAWSQMAKNAAPSRRLAVLELGVRVATAADNMELAKARIAEAVSLAPANLPLLRQAADLALASRRFNDLAEIDAKMERAEGRGGVQWRLYRARRLLANGTPSPIAIAEARELLGEVSNIRPNLAIAESLLGFCDEISGNVRGAIERYENAVRLGDLRGETYERLARALLGQNRTADAQKILDQLAERGVMTEDSEWLKISAAGREGDAEGALRLAREAVQRNPKDPLRYRWLSRALHAAGKTDDAIKALAEASALAPDDVVVWNEQFSLLRRSGRTAEAEKTLLAISARQPTPALRKSLLGQGYYLLGDKDKAEQMLREAAALSPEDTSVLISLASVLEERDVGGAIEILEKVVKLDPKADRQRRNLAVLLAASQGEAGWARSQQLLAENKGEAGGKSPSGDDVRVAALLLARRKGSEATRKEGLEKALSIVEARRQGAAEIDPFDRLIAAEIYERLGAIEKSIPRYEEARSELRTLVDRTGAALVHQHAYVGLLLRFAANRDLAGGADWEQRRMALLRDVDQGLRRLAQAEKEAKQYPSMALLDQHARWLKETSGVKAAGEFLESQATARRDEMKDKAAQGRWMSQIGQLYESALEDKAAAERWLRGGYERADSGLGVLVAFLARQQRTSDAIDVCVAAGRTGREVEAIGLLATVLSEQAKPEHFKRLERLLAAAEKKYPKQPDVLFSIGSIRAMQGNAPEAIRLLERVVVLEPRNVLALNNLATLLAESPGRSADAVRHVEAAMRMAGRQPMLLDTLGTIYLHNGDAAKAAAVLREAVDSGATDARFWFHLAAAYHRSGRSGDARLALAEATKRGLEGEVLTAGDAILRAELEGGARRAG